MAHICFFAKSLLAHGQGGDERKVQFLFESVAKLGHRVTVLTTRHPLGVEREEAPGLEIRYLPHAPSRHLSAAYWRASSQAFEAIHSRDPFALVMDVSFAGYGWVVNCSQRWPLPFVPSLDGGWKDGLRNRWSENDGLRDLVHFFLRALPEWWWGYRRWYRGVIGAADRILVGKASVIPILVREFGAPEAKFRHTPTPADVERFRPDPALRARVREQYGLGEKQPVVLMARGSPNRKGSRWAWRPLVGFVKPSPTWGSWSPAEAPTKLP